MHKLYEYVCDELKDLEKKAEKGNLSMTEVQYADTLAHLKKNLMKADEMMEDEFGEYSMAYYPMTSYAEDGGGRGGYSTRRMSYAGRRRDAMGRYSRANDGFREDLENLIKDAPSEHVKQKLRDIVRDM